MTDGQSSRTRQAQASARSAATAENASTPLRRPRTTAQAGTSSRRSATGAQSSTRRTREVSPSRSAETDERLRRYTRTAPPGRSAREDESRVRRPAEERRARSAQSAGQQSVPARILSVLAAVGRAIVGAFETLRERTPALQRFSAPMLTAMAGALIVCVVVVGFAVGGHGSSQPQTLEVDMEGQQSSQSAEPTNAANAVNPDEPADLAWRDADFAVDPTFHEWSNKDNGRKVVFLTIDDGPSNLTEQYLDLFDKYNVKATFFVTGHDPNYYHLIREAYNRGHTIGLHSMTHDYDVIYSSEEAFYKDLDEVGQVVKDQIGYVPCFIRFPGGSSNTRAEGLAPGLMPKLVNGVQARGYQYYDWSLASGDGEDRSTKELVSISTEANGTEYDPTKDTNIVLLCHDSATKQTTLEALPQIIEHYQKEGYSFEAIDRKTWVCHHGVYIPEADSTDDQDAEEGQDGSEAQDFADDQQGEDDGVDE